jgi:hypothetical protein
MVSFSLPPISDNPDGSWGPSSSNMPSEYKFREIPYAPYSKSDKLGRFADWYESTGDSRNPATGLSTTPGTRSGPTRGRKEGTQTFGSGTANAFAYFHAEDESSFSLVDNKAIVARRGGAITRGRTQGRGTSAYNRGGQRSGGPTRGGPQRGGGGQRGARRGWRDWDKVRKYYFTLVPVIDSQFTPIGWSCSRIFCHNQSCMADAGRNRDASVIKAADGSRRTRGSVSSKVFLTSCDSNSSQGDPMAGCSHTIKVTTVSIRSSNVRCKHKIGLNTTLPRVMTPLCKR